MIKGATRPGTVEKLKREAKAAGVTWIKKIDGSSSQYRFACTHEETLFTSSIRDKKYSLKDSKSEDALMSRLASGQKVPVDPKQMKKLTTKNYS